MEMMLYLILILEEQSIVPPGFHKRLGARVALERATGIPARTRLVQHEWGVENGRQTPWTEMWPKSVEECKVATI